LSSSRLESQDQLFETSILAIYRRWYELPRRSTLPRLETLRAQCAQDLAALAPTPATTLDPTRCEQILIGCAQALRRLAGVDQAAGPDLRRLAEAAPRSLQQPVRGMPFALTDTSPARVATLVVLLRQPDPAAYAIGLLYYHPADAFDIWLAVQNKLREVKPSLPAAAADEVAAITAQAEQALAQSATPFQQAQAYIAALEALERIPGLLPVLAPILAERKKLTPPPPDRGLLSRPYEPTTGEVRESYTAGEAGEEADGEPLSKSPTTQPAEVALHTDIRFPARVRLNEVAWLTVRLTLDKAAESRVDETVTVVFAEPGAPEYVEVWVKATGFQEETGAWERTIAVYPGRSSQPAVFLLRAAENGRQRVTIDFYHRGRLAGSAAFETEVGTGAQGVPATPQTHPVTLTAGAPPAADLVVRVMKAADANRLLFRVSSPHLPQPWDDLEEVVLTSKDPMTFLTADLEELSRLAAAVTPATPQGEQEAARDWFTQLGEGLFEDLLPKTFQERYWTQIRPLQQQGKLRTLLVISDEPWIPWEIIKPYRWDPATGREETEDFWVETYQMSRWLAGRGLAPGVAISAAALVLPDVGLAAVAAEKEFFARLAADYRLDVGAPLQARDEVLRTLMTGGFQLLHFATHGNFNSVDAGESEIVLVDASLRPNDLRGSGLRGIRQARPLVFLNACHGGRTDFGLTGLGGWADKLFNEAWATAFVGALWEVNDELAAQFSSEFYRCLAAGATFGAALQAARRALRGHCASNPTWLAYTLYGDPNATAPIGRRE
jgi:hypothetical protein